MERSLSKLFSSRGFFYVVIAAAIIGQIVTSILFGEVIFGFIAVIAEVILIIAYFKKERRLMMYLSSVLLVCIGGNSIVWLIALNPIDKVCGIAYLLLVLAFAVDHFWFFASKEKGGKQIAVNQILCFIILLVLIIWNAISISYTNSARGILGYAFEILSLAGAFFLFACSETLLKKLKD